MPTLNPPRRTLASDLHRLARHRATRVALDTLRAAAFVAALWVGIVALDAIAPVVRSW